jgi:hypothetical protein
MSDFETAGFAIATSNQPNVFNKVNLGTALRCYIETTMAIIISPEFKVVFADTLDWRSSRASWSWSRPTSSSIQDSPAVMASAIYCIYRHATPIYALTHSTIPVDCCFCMLASHLSL